MHQLELKHSAFVAMSAISLANLGVEYVDSLVLHSPYPAHSDTMKAWRAMESAVEVGHARQLGISTCSAP